MTLPRRKVLKLLAHFVKWLATYVWLFNIKKVHREWRYEGIPLGHWIKKEYWNICRHKAATRIVSGIERYRSVCEDLQPDAILYVHEFVSTGRQLSAAVEGETSLVGVQHGMINREHTVYQFCRDDFSRSPRRPVDHVHRCPAPDVLASFGMHYVERFQQWQGYPADRVVPVGGLRHDALVDRYLIGKDSSAQKKRAVREEMGLPVEETVVLLCTSRTRYTGKWFKMVLRALGSADLAAFVAVKTHQYHGGESFVHDVAEEYQFTRYEVFDSNVYDLIYGADAMVAGPSTTTVESYLLKTPVISIVADPDYEVYPFTKERIGDPVTDYGEMANVLKRHLSQSEERGSDAAFEEERERILKRHLHNEDGAACDRLAALIKNGRRFS